MSDINLQEEREAIVRDFGNKLAMQLTPSNEAMNVVRWAREELITALLSHEEKVVAKVREEEKANCERRMEAGYHLTKYIKDPHLVSKGMVAALCCCHDAFVIKTDEELEQVVANISDEDEELKYTVVRIEDAHLICGDFYNDVKSCLNCPRVRKLQALTLPITDESARGRIEGIYEGNKPV